MKNIRIFDTTLRDGQQCPGAGMTFSENIKYAHLASKLKIDVIEAGFPSASNLDFEIVKTICDELKSIKDGPAVAALCQLRENQVEKTLLALEPIKNAGRALLHVYVPVAQDLMEASLGAKADKSKLVEDLGRLVLLATSSGFEVEFSPEAYSRQGNNFDFATDLILSAVSSGASIINCPDTIGGAFQYSGLEDFVSQMNRHSSIVSEHYPDREIIWSTHCHNDFGLAVANSMRAVYEGPATQIEGCFNGVGERAGNTALESVIMLFNEYGGDKYKTRCDVSLIQEVSDFVSRVMLPRQPHWPVTGNNAARHSSGGHTNAVLNNPLAYQPFDPRQIGKEVSFVFGPLSGSNHAQDIISRAGFTCDDSERALIAQRIKDLYSDRRKGVTDEEVLDGYIALKSPISITNFDYSRSSTKVRLVMTGKFFDEEGTLTEEFEGKDSALAAFKKLVDKKFACDIVSHSSHSDTAGIDASSISKIVIKIRNSKGQEILVEGTGNDSDIEISALRALENAVNRAYINLNYVK